MKKYFATIVVLAAVMAAGSASAQKQDFAWVKNFENGRWFETDRFGFKLYFINVKSLELLDNMIRKGQGPITTYADVPSESAIGNQFEITFGDSSWSFIGKLMKIQTTRWAPYPEADFLLKNGSTAMIFFLQGEQCYGLKLKEIKH